MKNQLQYLLITLAFFAAIAHAAAQGSLTPPSGPITPNMPTLSQIEPRTPVTGPTNITQLGSYYLTTNIAVTSGDAIDITASDVTLDLNGFTISSTEASPTGVAINLKGLKNYRIFNGTIVGGVSFSGGTYNGFGFAYGIYYTNHTPLNARIKDVSVSGCLDDGINLGTGNSSVIESCTVNTVGGNGLVADSVANSSANVCGNYGILGQTVQNSSASSIYDDGIHANFTALNCYGTSGAADGVNVGFTAENCYGNSQDLGTGLNAGTAQNCYGTSYLWTGLNAGNAQNCYGTSSSGTGLNAGTASGCYGSSSGGTGLNAGTAFNCQGFSTNGTGMNILYIAEGCLGSSSNCTGLNCANAPYVIDVHGDPYVAGGYATMAFNCFGYSGWDGYGTNNFYGIMVDCGNFCGGFSPWAPVGCFDPRSTNLIYFYPYTPGDY